MVTIGEIADFLEVRCTFGIREREIIGVAGPDNAGGDQVCFAIDETSLRKVLGTSCALVLAGLETATTDARVLRVAEPRVSFALVYQRFFSPKAVQETHSTAVIEEEVTVGPGCNFGPHTFLGRGSQLGKGCRLEAGVVVCAGTVLGDRVVVKAGAVLGSAGFGYVRLADGKYIPFPQIGTLVVEDDVEIGANTTIDRGSLGETRVGRGTKIDNLVHIGHNCRIGEDVVIAAQTGLSGSVVIGNRAVIGGQVGIGDHATIGEGVILGSGSGVLTGKKLYGPGQVFWGIPAQPLQQYLRGLARFRRG